MADNHYADNESYYQCRADRRSSAAQGRAAQKFIEHVKPWSVVADFGCGTGGILQNLECRRRIGIEVNQLSKRTARENGIEVHSDLEELPDASVDIVITHHALEHVDNPWSVLEEIHRVLKPQGKFVAVVPAENPHRRARRFMKKDPDRHLYSWNARSFANLVGAAGFDVQECELAQIGDSKYLKPVESIPMLHKLGKRLVATLLDRYEIRSVAVKR